MALIQLIVPILYNIRTDMCGLFIELLCLSGWQLKSNSIAKLSLIPLYLFFHYFSYPNPNVSVQRAVGLDFWKTKANPIIPSDTINEKVLIYWNRYVLNPFIILIRCVYHNPEEPITLEEDLPRIISILVKNLTGPFSFSIF